MQLSRLLLTTDLSAESLRAFAPLAALARTQGSTITLLHVVEDISLIPRGSAFAAPIHLPGGDEDERHAEQWLTEHAREALGDLPLEVRVIRADKAGPAIAHYASEHGFDLIAMSTHGRTGFRALFVGSVAESVLRHADRPVLVFPRND